MGCATALGRIGDVRCSLLGLPWGQAQKAFSLLLDGKEGVLQLSKLKHAVAIFVEHVKELMDVARRCVHAQLEQREPHLVLGNASISIGVGFSEEVKDASVVSGEGRHQIAGQPRDPLPLDRNPLVLGYEEAHCSGQRSNRRFDTQKELRKVFASRCMQTKPKAKVADVPVFLLHVLL